MFPGFMKTKFIKKSQLDSPDSLPVHLTNISHLDTMFESGKEAEYFSAGKLALDLCFRISGFNPEQRLNILDFPSGYGRVLRYFRHGFPRANLYACELDSRMLDFTSREFGSLSVQANEKCLMTFPVKMDLIWTGSLLTHFDEWQWDNYFETIEKSLTDKGVAIFTTHGRRHATMAKDGHPIFGDIIDLDRLHEGYRVSGFQFLPYSSEYPTFGLSLSSPSWVTSKLQKYSNLEICYFEEGAWGQDVWAIKKAKWKLAE
jgi:SAM-dependent methyltransferase